MQGLPSETALRRRLCYVVQTSCKLHCDVGSDITNGDLDAAKCSSVEMMNSLAVSLYLKQRLSGGCTDYETMDYLNQANSRKALVITLSSIIHHFSSIQITPLEQNLPDPANMHFTHLICASAFALGSMAFETMSHGAVDDYNGGQIKWQQFAKDVWAGIPIDEWNETSK